MRHFDLAAFACMTLVVCNLPGVVRAQPPAPGDGPGERFAHRRGPDPERFLELHGDELGLSAETRAAIEKIVEESHANARQLRLEARADREQLRALLEQSEPDEDAVMKLSEALNDRESTLRQDRLRAILAIHGLLTAEQRAQLVAMRRDRRSSRPFGLLRACRGDVQKVCAEAEPGRDMLRCLSENWDDLSAECRQGLERGPRGGFQRGGDPDASDD